MSVTDVAASIEGVAATLRHRADELRARRLEIDVQIGELEAAAAALLAAKGTIAGLRDVPAIVPAAVATDPPPPAAAVGASDLPPTRNGDGPKRRFTESEREAAVELAVEVGIPEASRRTGRSPESLRIWCRQAGVRVPDARRLARSLVGSSGSPLPKGSDDEPSAEGPTARCPLCRMVVPVTVAGDFPARDAIRRHQDDDCPGRAQRAG